MTSVIPPGHKLGYHNPFAVRNLTSAFLNNARLRSRIVELEAEVIRLGSIIDHQRKGGSIPPEQERADGN